MTDIQSLHTKIDFLTQQITDFRADFSSKLLEYDKKINELEILLLQCQERTVQQEQRSRNYCIRVKGDKRPPPIFHVRFIHVWFRFRELRNSILQKRDSLKGVSVDQNEKRMGVSSYWITQDLTTKGQE